VLDDVCALFLNTWAGAAGLLLGGRVASYYISEFVASAVSRAGPGSF
jgi:hypothetical protein